MQHLLLAAFLITAPAPSATAETRTLFKEGFETPDRKRRLPRRWTHFGKARTASAEAQKRSRARGLKLR